MDHHRRTAASPIRSFSMTAGCVACESRRLLHAARALEKARRNTRRVGAMPDGNDHRQMTSSRLGACRALNVRPTLELTLSCHATTSIVCAAQARRCGWRVRYQRLWFFSCLDEVVGRHFLVAAVRVSSWFSSTGNETINGPQLYPRRLFCLPLSQQINTSRLALPVRRSSSWPAPQPLRAQIKTWRRK